VVVVVVVVVTEVVVAAAGRARRQRLEVGAACQGHLVQSCIAPPFLQAAETLGCRPG